LIAGDHFCIEAPMTALTAAERARLADIIFARSFGRGKVILASGKESDFYFDMKPSMLHPEGAALIARAVLEEVRKSGATHVGGLEMGAVPITGALCQHSFEAGAPVQGFFVRKQVKDHGAKKRVEGLPKGETLAGKDIVIVEDVTTTGESAWKAAQACIEDGAKLKMVVTIVDREDGAEEFYKSKGVPFATIFRAREFLAR
jgi:orotate phosphoribosyltransferase